MSRRDAWVGGGPNALSPEAYLLAVAQDMTEAVLQRKVEEALSATGWRWFHAPDNRPAGKAGRVQRVVPGFPDLCAVNARQCRVLYAELKRHTGRVSPDQAAWHLDLRRAGQEVHVWRPMDLLNGTILDVLTGRNTR